MRLRTLSSRFTLVRFQAWKVDGGASVVSNGHVRSDGHGCYGSGSGSQGVEPRHVTSLAHPSNVERHRASGRWFETIQLGSRLFTTGADQPRAVGVRAIAPAR